jgi:hypothetical protein
MDHEPAKNKIGIKGRVDLFEVEPASPHKNPSDFPNPFFPVLQMMDDAEIEDCICTGVRVRKVLGIGNAEKRDSSCFAVKPFLRESDHQGIDINAVQPTRVKHIVNELRSFSSAAADLDAKGVQRKAQALPKKGHFSSLNPSAHRAVDPDSFRPIDFHTFRMALS